jgi:hypothetical protein
MHRRTSIVLGLATAGIFAWPVLAQTFIGNPTQGNGWSTTSAVSIVAHGGEAPNDRGWINTINGSGLDFATGLLHETGGPTGKMGLYRVPGEGGGVGLGEKPGIVAGNQWIVYGFDQAYQLGNMFVWNYNEDGSPTYKNFGMKIVTIQTAMTNSSNPADWTTVFTGTVGIAPGAANAPVSSIIDLNGATAQYVAITADPGINRNWSSGQYSEVGLSEVRFAQFDVNSAVGWKNDASGDWNVASNWRQGFAPSGPGQEALFGDRITAPRTVFTDSAVSVSTLTFDCNSSYQITGQGSLSMVVNSGTAAVNVLRGSHKINLPMYIANNTNLTTAAGATLRISDPLVLGDGLTLNKNGDGTLTVQSTIDAPLPAVIKVNGGVANFDAANSNPNISINIDPATMNLGANQTLGNVTLSLGGNALNVGVNSAGTNVSAKLTANNMFVTGGGAANVLNQTLAGNTLKVLDLLQIDAGSSAVKQGPGVLRIGSLSIDSTGKLDITNGKMIVDYNGDSPLATVVKPALVAGRNGGAWTGNGLTSSTAAADSVHLAVGYAEASDLGIGSFSGEDVDASAIIIRTTYKGDNNLDGVVDSNDFNGLVAGYGVNTDALWVQGDYNYDGKVNSIDFNDLAGNFGAVAPAPALGSVVPEPASLSVLAVAGALIRRRR